MPGDMKIWTFTAGVLLAGPAIAELREMPDYFVDALVATSTAQAVALSCPKLSVNPIAVVQASDALLEQLQADGVDVADPSSSFLPGDDKLAAAQAAFMDKHTLEGAGADAVCAAGRAEIDEGTAIGQLLVGEATQ